MSGEPASLPPKAPLRVDGRWRYDEIDVLTWKAPSSLDRWRNTSHDCSTFPVYTTFAPAPPPSTLKTICSQIHRAAASHQKWSLDELTECGLLVAPAPSSDHHGKSLEQVFEHHAAQDFSTTEDQQSPKWSARACVVVTEEDWETKGLMLVAVEFVDGKESKVLSCEGSLEKLGAALLAIRLNYDWLEREIDNIVGNEDRYL